MKSPHPAIACIALALHLALLGTACAADAVVSNLGAEPATARVFTDASGQPLPTGCFVQLAHFPGTTDQELAGLATQGLESLLAAATAFGAPSAIGVGTGEAGTIELQASQELAQAVTGLHLIVANSASPAAASEFMVLRLAGMISADEITGPAAHTSFDLTGAVAVFGQVVPTGFATAAAAAAGYEGWISQQLGPGSSAADRLPDADPDTDGRVNLLEYATGTPPGSGRQVECLSVRRDAAGQMEALFLRRTGESGMRYHVDFRDHLGEGSWVELPPVATPATSPPAAPEGFEWMRQPLPEGARGFARLRVETTP
jgi:hypothetical protein